MPGANGRSRGNRWRCALPLLALAALSLSAAAPSADAYRAYVVNTESASVSVIDTESNQVVGAPIPVGPNPFGIATAPDGKRAYVAAPSGVWVIDSEDDRVNRPPIPIEGRLPTHIAITPDGGTAYVTSGFFSDVASVDLQLASEVERPIPVESEPSEVVVSPDGRSAYVLRGTAEKTGVTVLDIWGNGAAVSIRLDMNPADFDLTPDGKTLYVTGTTSDLSVSGVWRIDTESNRVVGAVIPVPYPGGIAITPGGRFAYVTRPFYGVSVIDLRTNEVVGSPIPIPSPTDLAITPDGLFAYVTSYFTNSVWPIDTRTNEVVGEAISVGAAPFSISIAEDLPSVRIGCPGGESACRMTLQAVTRRAKGRAQTAAINVKLRSKRPRLVSLRPRRRFAHRIARARRILVKETFQVHGKRRTAYRRLRVFH